MTEAVKISSARARAVEVTRPGPFEIRSSPAGFHVGLRQGSATQEAIDDATPAVIDALDAWVKACRAAMAGEVMP